MKFLGGVTTLDSFLKAYKAKETKGFFPYERFDNPEKLDFPKLPPYEAFFSKHRIIFSTSFITFACFNNFVQSVVDARREGDENLFSGVVAETMKLLGNSSHGYQIMDESRHTITKYLNDENTHKAINEPISSKD